MDTSRDFVMMKGGHMIMIVEGDMLLMENDVLASDGSQVKLDGTVVAPDGSTYMLAENEALIIDLATSRITET